jgi:hypothetical protein
VKRNVSRNFTDQFTFTFITSAIHENNVVTRQPPILTDKFGKPGWSSQGRKIGRLPKRQAQQIRIIDHSSTPWESSATEIMS